MSKYSQTKRIAAVFPRRFGAVALALGLGGLVLGAQAAVAGDLAKVKERRRLVMLCFPNQDNPMVSANLDIMREQHLKLTDLKRPDQFIGIEVDILQGFAKSLGVELEIHALTTGYDAVLPALIRHQGDVAASSLTITPKRLRIVDFSSPFHSTWVLVIVPRASRIATLADLAGKRAAVMRGSSQVEFLLQAAPAAKTVLTTFLAENFLAIDDGKADFTLIDSTTPGGESLADIYRSGYHDFKAAFPLRKADNGVAVRKGSDLLAPLNAYLAGIRQSGELERIFEKHRPRARAGG